jgi:hypothetical protein
MTPPTSHKLDKEVLLKILSELASSSKNKSAAGMDQPERPSRISAA